jgi:hypothetical protein
MAQSPRDLNGTNKLAGVTVLFVLLSDSLKSATTEINEEGKVLMEDERRGLKLFHYSSST